ARGKRVQRENRMEGGRNADFYCGFIVLPPSVRLSLCISGSRTIDVDEKNNIDEKKLFGEQLTVSKRVTIEE
ncbi:MAG: hypothetical protein MJ100_10420, partial [Ruminococcus sp.]|nr:hypothetical protein [Ruminococcus sp.]